LPVIGAVILIIHPDVERHDVQRCTAALFFLCRSFMDEKMAYKNSQQRKNILFHGLYGPWTLTALNNFNHIVHMRSAHTLLNRTRRAWAKKLLYYFCRQPALRRAVW